MIKEGRIKLVQVSADSVLGGGPKHILGILSNIDQNLFEPFLVCPPGYLSAEGKLISGVKVFNFNPKSKFDLFAILKLRSVFHQIKSSHDPFGPMIVHSHGSRGGLMARAANLFGVKTVYTEHRFDQNFHLKNPINELIQKKILKKQNLRTDLLIAVSYSVKKYLVESRMAVEKKIAVIPNAIDLDEFRYKDLKENKAVGTRAPIIGTIGNLNYQKGQIYLIEAMKEIRKECPLATLEIIGEGEERKILEAEIKRLGLKHAVTLLGRKSEVEKYMKHWSVFVLPSIAETFGIVILEAMHAGVPIVASSVGGVKDIITHNKNGILVPAKDKNALADAIIDVLKRPALSAKLNREGRDRVADFSWRNIIKQIEERYIELIM